MNQDQIIASVIDYLNNNPENPHFALCMYGGWGTGKTHFCKNILAPRIKDATECSSVHVSLFGVDSVSQLYERLLVSFANVSENKALCDTIKLGGKALLDWANKSLKKVGVSVSVSPEALVSLLSFDKRLIIFDDVERCGIKEELLYGLVNDMTENKHWFVLVVRNTPISFSNDEHGFEAEKTFLRQLKFEADPEALYDAILTTKLIDVSKLDLDVRKACIEAFRRYGEVDVRALLRLAPALNSVIKADALNTDLYDKSGRENSLSDFVVYALLTLSGHRPKAPIDKTVDVESYKQKVTYEQFCVVTHNIFRKLTTA